MAIASHMSSSSSVTALVLSWGIDESEVAVVGVFGIDVAVSPRVVRAGLIGRNMLRGSSLACDVIGWRWMVVVFVEVGVGASIGHRCEGSEPADCAIMYRSRDASSDDMIGEVCVRNSRSRLRNKVSCIFFGETLTIRYDVICTVVLAVDVN